MRTWWKRWRFVTGSVRFWPVMMSLHGPPTTPTPLLTPPLNSNPPQWPSGRYEEALEEHRQELWLLEGAGDDLCCAMAPRKMGERLAELESYEAALKVGLRDLRGGTETLGGGLSALFFSPFPAPTATLAAGPVPSPGKLQQLPAFFFLSAGSVAHREITEMRSWLYLNLGLVYDSLKEPAKCDHYIKKSIFLSE